ncbi:MAG TPA: hypothetical protein DET40_16220 [Lentisphaeria bacterium]|nr:MAG: hypothetical protein A2X45_22575 [Lentisphaerae bacterium GWF2_50_93]HCE45087.1 hypothetical protein [Lentisphaeria bacterium]
MAKFKTWLIAAAIVLFLVVVTYIMNLPIFSGGSIPMDKYKAPDLAKTDFEKGTIRFIEVYKEDPKEKDAPADAPVTGRWEIPASKEIGKTALEKYHQRARIEPDYGKDDKTFKKEESGFANSYNRTMLGLVLAKDPAVNVKNIPPPAKDAAPKKDAKPAAKPAAKPVAAKPPPPPPVIIDSGDIPMDKVKGPDLAKTDIERGKIRFVEVYREDSKKPGSGKWEVFFAKEIGKELLEKYPDRIKVEKKPDVDPKKFQKDEGSFASSYNKAIFKFLNPEAPMFKPPPPKPSDKNKKTDTAKKPAEPAKPPQEKKPEEVKQPAQPTEKIDLLQKLEQPPETPAMAIENKDAQPEKAMEQPKPTDKPEEPAKPVADAGQPAQEKPVGKVEDQTNQ